VFDAKLEQLLVRYVVDTTKMWMHGWGIKAESGDGRQDGLPTRLMGDRELDICLMRRERRTVYRSGYIQFANLTCSCEHLGAYAENQ